MEADISAYIQGNGRRAHVYLEVKRITVGHVLLRIRDFISFCNDNERCLL